MIDSSLAYADLLTTYLNGQSWTQTFTAERPESLEPPAEPSYYVDALRCIVIPREDEYERIDRDITVAGEYQLDAFLACHVDFLSSALVYAQAHAFVRKFLKNPQALEGGFITAVRRTLWLPTTLSDKKIFGTVVTVELRTTVDDDEA